MDNKEIFSLKLHQSISFQTEDAVVKVLRVPGGWIYTTFTTLKEKKVPKVINAKGGSGGTSVSGSVQELEIVDEADMVERSYVSSIFVPMTSEFNS